MKRAVRVILYGLGNMGSGVARNLLEKRGFKIVGAICGTDDKNGKDLGEILNLGRSLGVRAWKDPQKVLGKKADILIHTRKDAEEVFEAVRAGVNVISIAGGLAYPFISHSEFGEEVDRLARKMGVTVLGTGVNPGFIFDTFIITLTGVCHRISQIKAFRSIDTTPFTGSSMLMKQLGMGLREEEFNQQVQEKKITPHSPLESMEMIADVLGWEIGRVEERAMPILSGIRKETATLVISPGQVSGFSSMARAFSSSENLLMTMEVQYHVMPDADGHEIEDHIEIEGIPPIDLRVRPCISSYYGTTASVVNNIHKVINARPGLITMKDLPVPHALMKDVREFLK
jgi:4-hydroxy-tetrahydrodipicolinate reductase